MKLCKLQLRITLTKFYITFVSKNKTFSETSFVAVIPNRPILTCVRFKNAFPERHILHFARDIKYLLRNKLFLSRIVIDLEIS